MDEMKNEALNSELTEQDVAAENASLADNKLDSVSGGGAENGKSAGRLYDGNTDVTLKRPAEKAEALGAEISGSKRLSYLRDKYLGSDLKDSALGSEIRDAYLGSEKADKK